MIPDRDEFWLTSAASRLPPGPAAASGPLNHQPQHNSDADVSTTSSRDENDELREIKPSNQRGDTAWERYCNYVESMTSRGQKINQRIALEAMFRGNNLVYRAQPQDCAAS